MTDLIGSKFSRWTVLKHDHQQGCKIYYLCRCDCGAEKVVRKDQLTRGISKSCGCWKKEVAAAQLKRIFTTHGQANKTRTYAIWKEMRKRCMNPLHHSYSLYGGRGITICERWGDYSNFLADMGEVPDNIHSLDRIDFNGNYEPTNCRWADKKTQANNTRANIFIKYRGELLTLKQWAEKLRIPYACVYQRIFKLSWPIEKAFTEPVQQHQ